MLLATRKGCFDKLGVEQDLVPAEYQDRLRDLLDRTNLGLLRQTHHARGHSRLKSQTATSKSLRAGGPCLDRRLSAYCRITDGGPAATTLLLLRHWRPDADVQLPQLRLTNLSGRIGHEIRGRLRLGECNDLAN